MSASDWVEDAACTGTDPDIFFTEHLSVTKQAIKICQGCNVRQECLAAAMEEETLPRYGIRGGLRPGARSQLAKGLKR